jgi:hypothetical protein
LLAALSDGTLQVPPDTAAGFWRMRLNKFGRQKWHVQIEPAYEHPRGVIRYLGAYLRRGPIGESRIKRYDRRDVTIAYKRSAEHPQATFTLAATEFVRRFLVHVPPKGQRVVRHFGLFHHRQRARLEQARQQITPVAIARAAATAPSARRTAAAPPLCCPRCGKALVVVAVTFCSRAPPQRQVV